MDLPRRAFTFVEAIMVIVIIGILVTVSLPRMSVFYTLTFQSAGKKLLGDLRYAQTFAMTHHVNSAVQFYAANDNYSAVFCGNSACFPMASYPANWSAMSDPLTRGSLGVDYRSDAQYHRIDIVSAGFGGATSLVFNPQGVPCDVTTGSALTADGTLTLGYKGDTITFTIRQKTGKIDVAKTF